MLNVSLLRFGGGFVNFVLVLALDCNFATAQPAYPAHPVRFVVGFGAGTPPDVATRIVAEKLSAIWGMTTIVENVVGASGNFAGERVARARPDGYTLLVAPNSGILINPHLFRNMPFNPMRDLVPVSVIYSYPNVLIVNPKLGVSTVKELIEKAKAEPGAIAYGSQGIGATSHLTTALFETMAGVKFNHVPYRGTAPAMNDLVGGHILFMFDNLASSLPQHQAGKLKILAVCTPQRSPHLPDVPTMSEAALPGFTSVAWFGLVAPPGTPDEIAEKISTDVAAVLKSEDIRSKFQAHGAEPIGNSRKDAEAFMQAERALWADVIEKAKLKAPE